MISLVSRTETRSLWSRFQNYLNTIFLLEHLTTLGARGFSCANSGFGQVLKSDSREKLRRSCLRPSADETKLPVAREKKPLVPRVASYQLVTPCSLFSPAQTLADFQLYTRPSTQDAPLHDLSGAVGPVPVPLDPAGKVFTYLFSSVVQLKQNNFIGL